MKIRKFLTLAVTLGAKAGHAAVGAAVAAVTAVALDFSDPFPWVIGAFGGAILFLKRDEVSRKDSIGTVLISVGMGGLVAPWAAAFCAWHFDPRLSNSYPFAFALSTAWPFILPKLLDRLPALPDIFGGKK